MDQRADVNGCHALLSVYTSNQRLFRLARDSALVLDLELQRHTQVDTLYPGSRDMRGVVLLDLVFAPPGARASVIDRLAGSPYAAPVIAHVQHVTPPIVVRLMQAGAYDVVSAQLGGMALQNSLMNALAEEDRRYPQRCLIREARLRFARLSPREREVIEGVINGKLNKQIAAELEVSENTVEVHRAHALRKLGTRSPIEVARALVLCELDAGGASPLEPAAKVH